LYSSDCDAVALDLEIRDGARISVTPLKECLNFGNLPLQLRRAGLAASAAAARVFREPTRRAACSCGPAGLVPANYLQVLLPSKAQ
jgi:hypothetical protein